MSMTSNLIGKLKDREYRRGYVGAQINVGVPFQIRALRRQRGWSQGRLAEETEMLQPRISAIEKPGNGKLNIETLKRLANAFDVGLEVRFVPFSQLIDSSESFDPDGFSVKPFDEEFRETGVTSGQQRQGEEGLLVRATQSGIGDRQQYPGANGKAEQSWTQPGSLREAAVQSVHSASERLDFSPQNISFRQESISERPSHGNR